jgi:hypothetical protein
MFNRWTLLPTEWPAGLWLTPTAAMRDRCGAQAMAAEVQPFSGENPQLTFDQASRSADEGAGKWPGRSRSAAYLRAAAWALYLEAAISLVRRGAVDQARSDVEAALRLLRQESAGSPRRTVWLIPTAAALELVGAHDVALELLDEAQLLLRQEEGPHADATALLAVQRALLLAHLGRFQEGWDALREVPVDGLSNRTAALLAWLHAALALRTGRAGDDVWSMNVPAELTYEEGAWRDALAWWWTAATGDDALRRQRRYLARGELGTSFFDLEPVLPAVLYLVGMAAGDGDRELWLDRMGDNLLAIEPRQLMAARAEAALWAGDAEAAAAWQARLATYQALAPDDRSGLLLDLLAR